MFVFQTKGNLTKHMKSKVHQRKCFELGIVPVPMTVDESQLDPDMLVHHVEVQDDGKVGLRLKMSRGGTGPCFAKVKTRSFCEKYRPEVVCSATAAFCELGRLDPLHTIYVFCWKIISEAKNVARKCCAGLALFKLNSLFVNCKWLDLKFDFTFTVYFVFQVVEVNTSFDSEGAFDEDIDDDDDQSERFSESIEQEVEQEHAYIVMEGPDHHDL